MDDREKVKIIVFHIQKIDIYVERDIDIEIKQVQFLCLQM